MEAEQIASLVDASALEAFRASKTPVLTEELRTILTEVAQTGRLRDWRLLKPLLVFLLREALSSYSADGQETQQQVQAAAAQPLSPQVDAQWLVDAFESFEAPPFTVQRIVELLLNPKAFYSRASSLAFSLEKLLRVTSFADAVGEASLAGQPSNNTGGSEDDLLIERRTSFYR